jgi:hypothetical protein
MSTYLYLQCLDHDPPLVSDGEVGQHLYNLPQIQNDIVNRKVFVMAAKMADDNYRPLPDYGHHFRNNASRFLCQHAKCNIGIIDEYGHKHPTVEGHK